MDVSEIYQVINTYVSSSTAAFVAITGLVGSIFAFVAVAKKLVAAFPQKKFYAWTPVVRELPTLKICLAD